MGSSSPLLSLPQEIHWLFDDFGTSLAGFGAKRTLVPRMDVTETDKAIELAAELPGLEEKDVEINLADNVLTVRSEKKSEKEEEGQELSPHRKELRLLPALH